MEPVDTQARTAEQDHRPGTTQRDAQKVVADLESISAALDGEVAISVKAVSALMSTGLATSAQEAADMIANAVGGSANKGEDLLEVIWEYSAGWKNAGISAEGALAMIEQATDNGAWNADAPGDALREFGRRITEEGETIVETLNDIGLNGEEMYEAFQKRRRRLRGARQVLRQDPRHGGPSQAERRDHGPPRRHVRRLRGRVRQVGPIRGAEELRRVRGRGKRSSWHPRRQRGHLGGGRDELRVSRPRWTQGRGRRSVRAVHRRLRRQHLEQSCRRHSVLHRRRQRCLRWG
ncbi:hypothetical protein GS481_24880 [Rhodococcus hoagii]|nr:hypothetical protein [Prescottella equi]